MPRRAAEELVQWNSINPLDSPPGDLTALSTSIRNTSRQNPYPGIAGRPLYTLPMHLIAIPVIAS